MIPRSNTMAGGVGPVAIGYVAMRLRLSLVFGLFFLLAACAGPESAPQPASPPTEAVPEPAARRPAAGSRVAGSPAAGSPAAGEILVIFLGDSLTAGYQLDESQAFPARVGAALSAAGHVVRIVNAGVSGDTTTGGLARLDWLLRQQPDVLVVGLGGNDGLHGTPVATSEANLRAIVMGARAAGARVLLAGMLIPPNYGPGYTREFAAVYPRLAAELDLPLIPFLLAGVAARPELNLEDGIHPNAEGQRSLARTVLAHLEPLLDTLP